MIGIGIWGGMASVQNKKKKKKDEELKKKEPFYRSSIITGICCLYNMEQSWKENMFFETITRETNAVQYHTKGC